MINLGSTFQVLGNWFAAAAVWIDAAGFIGSVLGIEAIGWFEDTEGSTDATVLFGVSIPRKDEVARHTQHRQLNLSSQVWRYVFWTCVAFAALYPVIVKKGLELAWQKKLGLDDRGQEAKCMTWPWFYTMILTAVS